MSDTAGKPVKQRVGAPKQHDVAAMAAAFLAYIENTNVPIATEFAYSQGLHREQLYQIPELSYALKLCMTKKECQLEKGALTGELTPSMAIFSLKQMGWKDNTRIENTGADGGPIDLNLVVSFVSPK